MPLSWQQGHAVGGWKGAFGVLQVGLGLGLGFWCVWRPILSSQLLIVREADVAAAQMSLMSPWCLSSWRCCRDLWRAAHPGSLFSVLIVILGQLFWSGKEKLNENEVTGVVDLHSSIGTLKQQGVGWTAAGLSLTHLLLLFPSYRRS